MYTLAEPMSHFKTADFLRTFFKDEIEKSISSFKNM